MTITRADLTDQLRERLHRIPHRPLISEDGRSSTGAEVLELVETKIVEYRRAAVGTHARVGIIGRTALDFVTDLYAVFALDAAVAPLPRTLTTWELPRYVDLAGLTHLSAPNDGSVSLGQPVASVGRRQLTANPAIRVTDNHAAAAVQLTSGTTGRQLAAARSASALLVEAENYIQSFDLTPDEFIGCPVPIHHAYGFGLCALAAPLAGTPVTYLSAKHPKLLRRAVNHQQVTLFASVPPMLRLLAELGTSTPMRCVTAGMPLDARSAELVGTRIGELGQVYGTTETGPICVRAPRDWRRTVESFGPPLPGVHVDLEYGTGLVSIHSPSMMDGYLDGPNVDPTAIASGRFRTGDLARWNNDELILVGRSSNCINVSGTKVSPEEIETVLLEFPGVDSALVTGVPDDSIGQRIKATVTAEHLDVDQLKRFRRRRLSPPKLPQLLEHVPELATTETGKVLRPKLDDQS